MKEIEAWGVTYERYALEKTLMRLAKRFSLQTVAEMPAHGAKAMPSIYSIGFAMAGAHVTLINGVEEYKKCWEKLNLQDMVEFLEADIHKPYLNDRLYDLVWNFAYLPLADDPHKLVEDMKRISKRYIAFFSVNFGNIGFHIHHNLHKIKKVPWTHGDIAFNKRGNIVKLMKQHGLKVVNKGFVDCPVWPDSLGFRDMRLHRENITFENADWESPYIDHSREARFPLWIKLVYAWEWLPMFSFIKTLYAHINYVIAEKTDIQQI